MVAEVIFERDRPSSPVAVLMTHYNCEAYLAAAVRSILEQSWRDLDLLVLDDGSPGEQWREVLAEFRADPRLRLFASDRNVGTYRLKSAVIPHLNARYLAFQDSDDLSSRARIERQLAALERRRLDILGCSFSRIDEAGHPIGDRHMPSSCNWLERLGKTHFVHPPSCIVRGRVFRTIGAFDGTTRIGADTDFVLRAARRFRIGNLREPLYLYRERRNSLTGDSETGYGSPVREAYAAAMRQRWRRQRRQGSAADLHPAAIDQSFTLREIA